MLRTKKNLPSIYNPGSQTKNETIENFVIRLKEFNELFSSIKNDRMLNPPQHFVVQGQRGYGKTTLLLRLKYELQNNRQLKKWLIPVMFDEEQYSVHALSKFWEEIIDILEYEYDEFKNISDKIDDFYDSKSPEEKIYKHLVSILLNKKKKIILLLDNFSEMIEKFDKKERQRLREVFNTSNQLRIIGTSSQILEFTHSYKEPFFDFFKVITLEELTKKETIRLLNKLGESYKATEIKKVIKEQPERIEALRRLTGGVPRTIILLFELFIDDVDGNSFKDLEIILDKVTPLYKDRLDNLKKNQQVIIDAVAQNWDGISVAEISAKTRMPSKVISAQLNQLEKNQLINKITTSTKNNLYQIKERFFNIYYLMRLGKRKNRNKVLWLVRFFEIWCSEQDLIKRTQKHIKALKRKCLFDKHAYYISYALSKTFLPLDLEDELIKETRKYLGQIKSEFITDLDKSKVEILDEAMEKVKTGQIENAIKFLINAGFNNDVSNFYLGNFFMDQKEYDQAIKYFIKASNKKIPEAMNNLGVIYKKEYKDHKKAEEYYLKASKFDVDEANYNLAQLYHYNFKNYRKAEKYYLSLIEKNTFNQYGLFNNLGLLYWKELKDYNKAEKYLLLAVKKYNSVHSIYNLAVLYDTSIENFKKAEKYYLMAISKGDKTAYHNLGSLYSNELPNFKKSEKYYLLSINEGDTCSMNNLAGLYFENRTKKEKALVLAKNSTVNSVHNYHYMTYVSVLLWNNKIDEAIKIFNEKLKTEEFFKEINSYINDLVVLFLAKKQFHFVYNLFKENYFDFIDKYKPTYYATLSLMDDISKDEIKRMGKELSETVQEILNEIKRLERNYK